MHRHQLWRVQGFSQWISPKIKTMPYFFDMQHVALCLTYCSEWHKYVSILTYSNIDFHLSGQGSLICHTRITELTNSTNISIALISYRRWGKYNVAVNVKCPNCQTLLRVDGMIYNTCYWVICDKSIVCPLWRIRIRVNKITIVQYSWTPTVMFRYFRNASAGILSTSIFFKCM